jgi:hypothetical protein
MKCTNMGNNPTIHKGFKVAKILDVKVDVLYEDD